MISSCTKKTLKTEANFMEETLGKYYQNATLAEVESNLIIKSME